MPDLVRKANIVLNDAYRDILFLKVGVDGLDSSAMSFV